MFYNYSGGVVSQDLKLMALQIVLPLIYYPYVHIQDQPIAAANDFHINNGTPAPPILEDCCLYHDTDPTKKALTKFSVVLECPLQKDPGQRPVRFHIGFLQKIFEINH